MTILQPSEVARRRQGKPGDWGRHPRARSRGALVEIGPKTGIRLSESSMGSEDKIASRLRSSSSRRIMPVHMDQATSPMRPKRKASIEDLEELGRRATEVIEEARRISLRPDNKKTLRTFTMSDVCKLLDLHPTAYYELIRTNPEFEGTKVDRQRLFSLADIHRLHRRRTAELLESFNLADRANALAGTLSGGMRRRLEIARGLVHDPQILFLDEPTTGLDPVSRISVWEMIAHLRAQQGHTLFLTTHYMDEADRLCDRIAIVNKGRIVALDTPVALKASVPGASRIEMQFEPDLPDGAADLEALPAVKSVRALGSATYRISSDRGPASAQELMELARAKQAGAEKPVGGIHQSGRCVSALHRPRAGGDGRSRRSGRTERRGGPR